MIRLIQIVRSKPTTAAATSGGMIEDIRAHPFVVIVLPILLLLVGLGCNYVLECARLSNAMALERYKVELQRSSPPAPR